MLCIYCIKINIIILYLLVDVSHNAMRWIPISNKPETVSNVLFKHLLKTLFEQKVDPKLNKIISYYRSIMHTVSYTHYTVQTSQYALHWYSRWSHCLLNAIM